jgi:hypothetical protein
LKNVVFWDVMPGALVRTDVSEELNTSFIKATRIGGSVLRLLVTASVVPSSPILVTSDEEGAKFLRNVGSYKSHTA